MKSANSIGSIALASATALLLAGCGANDDDITDRGAEFPEPEPATRMVAQPFLRLYTGMSDSHLGVQPVDVDNDGDQDLIIYGNSYFGYGKRGGQGRFFVFLNDGTGGYTARDSVEVPIK